MKRNDKIRYVTPKQAYERLLRELNRLYTMNHAVKKYREAQHDRT